MWGNSFHFNQCTRLDSNQRHSVSKTDALATKALQNKGDLIVVEEVYAVLHAVELKNDAPLPPTDHDLSAVVSAWAKLPSALKTGIETPKVVASKTKSGQRVWTVYLGEFATRAEAEKAIKKLGRKDLVVVENPK